MHCINTERNAEYGIFATDKLTVYSEVDYYMWFHFTNIPFLHFQKITAFQFSLFAHSFDFEQRME